MEDFTKCSPWVSYVHKLIALFGQDPDITIEYKSSQDNEMVALRVSGQDKANAISKILPGQINVGGRTVVIQIIPSNEGNNVQRIFEMAFRDNPVFDKYIEICPEGTNNPFRYALFKPQVVQYWDDDLSNPHGITSDIPANIANYVLKDTFHVICSTSILPNVNYEGDGTCEKG